MMEKIKNYASSLGKWVKSKDQFGHSVTIKYDKANGTLQSRTGGLISILFNIIFLTLFIQFFDIMISKRAAVQFSKADLALDWDHGYFKDVNLGENDDTFGIVLGIDLKKGREFDWTDNPYIRANVYEKNSYKHHKEKTTLSKDLKMVKCKPE